MENPRFVRFRATVNVLVVGTFVGMFLSLPVAQEKEFGKMHEATTLVYPPARHAPIHKATALHLFAFMALIGRTDVVPSDPQALAVTRLKSTDDPLNRMDDDDLTVYGVNAGQNNIIFNSSMQSLDVYEGRGPRQRLKRPRGIACNADGDVYVADTGHDRIVRLHNPGNYLAFVDAYGKSGKKTGEFDEPSAVALAGDGTLYVADTGNDRIQVFDRSMQFLYVIPGKTDSLGTSGPLFRPAALALSDRAEHDLFYRESFLMVVDLNNSRLLKLTTDGRFVAGANSADYGYPKVYLTSVALDYYGNVWATDLLNHCVHKFDRNLRYITSFGTVGEGDNEFLEPRAIGIWKKLGQVFIVDKISAQYFHIGTDILDVNVSQQDSAIRFDFALTERSKVLVTVLDEDDRPVAQLATNRILDMGRHVFLWNRMPTVERVKRSRKSTGGTSDSAAAPFADSVRSELRLPSGLYRLRIEARTTYTFSRYFTKRAEVEFAF